VSARALFPDDHVLEAATFPRLFTLYLNGKIFGFAVIDVRT
jgi:hypothetical protein